MPPQPGGASYVLQGRFLKRMSLVRNSEVRGPQRSFILIASFLKRSDIKQ